MIQNQYLEYLANKIAITLEYRGIELDEEQNKELLKKISENPRRDIIKEARYINNTLDYDRSINSVEYHPGLMKKIDPDLTFSHSFRKNRNGVFKVKNTKGEFMVLKIANSSNPWAYDSIKREAKVLEVLSYYEEVPKMIQTYDMIIGKEKYFAFLREFFPGTSIERIPSSKQKQIIPKIKPKLEKIVMEIHKRGVARLDIYVGNILCKDNNCSIVDLGSAQLESEISHNDFEYLKKYDLEDVKWLR